MPTLPDDEPPPDVAAIDALLRGISPEPRASLGAEIAGRFHRGERAMKSVKRRLGELFPSWTVPVAAAAIIVGLQTAALAGGSSKASALAAASPATPATHLFPPHWLQNSQASFSRPHWREDWFENEDDGYHEDHHDHDYDRSMIASHYRRGHHDHDQDNDENDDDD